MSKLGEFFSAIFRNLLGYDAVIVLAALATLFFYIQLNRSYQELYNTMNHKIHVSHFRLSRQQTDNQVSKITIDNVIDMRTKEDMWYSLFVNFIAIFPLLGILGTVGSLLMLVSNTEDVTGNFYAALTSTFWGLVFAILYKVLDARIAPKIEDNTRSVQMFLDRVDTDMDEIMNDNNHMDGFEDASRRDTYSDRMTRSQYPAKKSKPAEIVMSKTSSETHEETPDVAAKAKTSGEQPRAYKEQIFGGEPEKDLDFGTAVPEPPVREESPVIRVRNEDVQIIADENGEDK